MPQAPGSTDITRTSSDESQLDLSQDLELGHKIISGGSIGDNDVLAEELTAPLGSAY